MIIYTFDIYFVKPILKGLFIILLNHCLILLVLQKAIGYGHRKITWYGPSVIPTRGTVGNEHSRTPVNKRRQAYHVFLFYLQQFQEEAFLIQL